ncbi:MAG: large subunit ribosomal protein L3 [Cellvibrionaceae bacterium]
MKGLLGKKVGMTQLIDDDGVATPVTIIQAGPCYVTQVKSEATDGYNAIQVGFGDLKEKGLTRGQKGHLGLLPADSKHPERKTIESESPVPALRHLREIRTDDVAEYSVGQQLAVTVFSAGQMVDVTGKSKGKGYAGVVKRHHFAGGPKTHGQSDRHRAPGSIGATSTPGRVFKGMRMAGRMGNERLTVQNLEVMRVDEERNLIAIKGAVPGTKGGLVMIRSAVKG